jgi:hypothetical protein
VKPLDVAALAESFLRKAKRFLWQDGHLAPVAFIVHPAGVETLDLRFKDTEDKCQAYAFVSNICRALRADAAILVNEVWAVMDQPRPGESVEDAIARAEELPPSEDPRRQEAITMLIFGPGFKPMLTILPFRRKGRKIKFGEKVTERDLPEVEVRMIPKWWTTDTPKVS